MVKQRNFIFFIFPFNYGAMEALLDSRRNDSDYDHINIILLQSQQLLYLPHVDI